MRIEHRRLANNLVIVIILIGLMVLLGWEFDIDVLKRPFPLLAAMNPWTAFCFILLGSSFLLINGKFIRRPFILLGRMLAILVMVISLCKLILPSATWPFNRLFFAKKVAIENAAGLPSNMAINTCINLLIAGCCILLLTSIFEKKQRITHYLALSNLVFSLFSIVGYLYQTREFIQLVIRLPMAVHTASSFILFSVAVLIHKPHTGISKEITTRLYGGYLARFLIPVSVIVPVILGGLYLLGYSKGLFSVQFGITILVVLYIVVINFFIWFSAAMLNRKDRLKLKTEQKLHEIEDDFNTIATSIKDYAIFIIDPDGKILSWNKGAELIKGYTEEEVKGRYIDIFYTEEDKRKGLPKIVLERASAMGSYELEGYRIKKNGSIFWATVVITSLYKENGTLRGFVKLTRDSTETKRTNDILSNFNAELNRQVVLKTAILEKTNFQLRQLAAHLQIVREEEREKIARELHDQLGQLFAGLKMDILWLRKKIDSENKELLKRLNRTLDLLDQTYQTVRMLSTDLHPALLHGLGLKAAIESYCQQFQQRSGLPVTVSRALSEDDEQWISGEIAIGLYRILQECLTNIFKHAVAHSVKIWLLIEEGVLTMGVEDDGKGFDPDNLEDNKTLGLVSIRERILMFNGEFKIDSIIGKGTIIWVIVPLN